MISDASRYYGCVLLQLVDSVGGRVVFQRLNGEVSGFYIINQCLPLYIKYSTSRKGPWTFNFQARHRDVQKELVLKYGECITAFACGSDGIVALRCAELYQVLDVDVSIQSAISICRGHNKMYNVKGQAGMLDRKISKNSLFETVSTYCKL